VFNTVRVGKGKVTVVPTYVMKAHREMEMQVWTKVSSELHTLTALSAVPIELEACWAPASPWSCVCGKLTYKSLVVQPVFQSPYRLCFS
jgi:hypothetical protein